MTAHPPLLDVLRRAVGDAHVLVGEADVSPYVTDWSRRWTGPCLAVVRPASTEEVVAVMRACADAGVPVLPQGGNTGLVGGSVPASVPGSLGAPVIVSLLRLNWIGEVDELSGQVSAGAGAVLGDLHRHVEAEGWTYGVDLAARDSCTIGGTVATNAGGIHVIARGMTRAQVVGIEAVLPDGSVVSHMAGLLKDNTGYDLAGLLCGSEGTLGIITVVRVRLHRPLGRTSVGLVGVSSYSDALTLMAAARASAFPVLAAEVLDESGIVQVQGVSDLPWPLEQRWPVIVVLELVDGGTGDGFAAILADEADAVVEFDAPGRARLWEYRERQSEAYSALGVAHKLDVSVPLPSLAACADELRAVVGSFPQSKVFGVFGHLADGNIHVELIGPEPDDLEVDHAVMACVARYGGSISAEHGVGRAKADDLSLCREPAEIAAMRAVKSALDPQGLMNPGVIFA